MLVEVMVQRQETRFQQFRSFGRAQSREWLAPWPPTTMVFSIRRLVHQATNRHPTTLPPQLEDVRQRARNWLFSWAIHDTFPALGFRELLRVRGRVVSCNPS
jgi:hypothetical protein